MALASTEFFDRVWRGRYQTLCRTLQAVTHFTRIFRFDDVELEEGDSFAFVGVTMTSREAAQLLMVINGAVLMPRVALAVGQTDEDVSR